MFYNCDSNTLPRGYKTFFNGMGPGRQYFEYVMIFDGFNNCKIHLKIGSFTYLVYFRGKCYI